VTTAREIQDELKASGRRLRAAIPQVYAGYAALHGAAMGDGALPAKVKELIALAIAVTRECDGCIAAHARSAVRQGVTAEEVAEAMGVVILMNGGPGTVWGPRLRRVRGVRRARRGQPTRVLTAPIRLVSADLASANSMLVFGFTYSSLSIPA
jgi:AhpD family alkylhydroperoxidase